MTSRKNTVFTQVGLCGVFTPAVRCQKSAKIYFIFQSDKNQNTSKFDFLHKCKTSAVGAPVVKGSFQPPGFFFFFNNGERCTQRCTCFSPLTRKTAALPRLQMTWVSHIGPFFSFFRFPKAGAVSPGCFYTLCLRQCLYGLKQIPSVEIGEQNKFTHYSYYS